MSTSTKKKMSPRVCYLCGNTYDKRNLIEGWTALRIKDPDSLRWRGTKEIRKVCTRCMDPGVANRLVGSAGVVNKTIHAILPLIPPRVKEYAERQLRVV